MFDLRLEKIARKLMHDEPYFAEWSTITLQAFIRDKARCQYCDPKAYLFEAYDVASCGDHLLPRRTHPDLAYALDNIVASCTECNQLKRDFNPSKGMPGTLSDPKYRDEMIARARTHVKGRRTETDWAKQFDRATGLLEKAIVEYHSGGQQ
jgi:HNH endonuclease